MSTEFARMVEGELFNPMDPHLVRLRRSAREACARFQSQPSKGHLKAVLDLFNERGNSCYLEPGVQLDYGTQMRVGDHFYANFNCVFLDAGWITIGNHVMLGPSVHIYTVTHPVERVSRRSGQEYALPVTIGDDVWIGGQSIILPGVTVGPGTVIAAGSLVRESVPDNVVVAGNPARIVKPLS